MGLNMLKYCKNFGMASTAIKVPPIIELKTEKNDAIKFALISLWVIWLKSDANIDVIIVIFKPNSTTFVRE